MLLTFSAFLSLTVGSGALVVDILVDGAFPDLQIKQRMGKYEFHNRHVWLISLIFSNTGSKLVESLGEMYRMLALLRFKIDVQSFNRLLNTNAISYRYHNSCTNKNIILSGLSPLSVSYFGCPAQVRIEKIALRRASAVPLRFAPKTICSSDRRLLSQTVRYIHRLLQQQGAHWRLGRGEDSLVNGSIPAEQPCVSLLV